MLRNAQTCIKNMVQPKYILVEGIIKIKMSYNDITKKQYSFPVNYLYSDNSDKNIGIDIYKLEELFDKYKKGDTCLSYSKKQAYSYSESICKSIIGQNLDPEEGLGRKILDDIRDLTHFECGMDKWDLTHMMRKYKLDSPTIFTALVQDAQPFNMGIYEYDAEKMRDPNTKFKEMLAASTNPYVSIDYWNGIGVKSAFPVDINNDETPFKMNIRRYNDRNNDSGFMRIIVTLLNRIASDHQLAESIYTILPDIASSDISSDSKTPGSTSELVSGSSLTTLLGWIKDSVSPVYDKTLDITANGKIVITPPLDGTDARYMWESAIEKRIQNSFNHRNNVYPDGVIWEYMMKPFYEKYIKDQPREYLSLAHLLCFDANTIHSTYDSKVAFSEVSIVNMLIYGKVNVNYNILDRLLSLIRFEKGDYSMQLDNYYIKDIYCGGNNMPVYTISWCENNINKLEFAKSDLDKLRIAKYLIKLMNETDPAKLNFNNYYHVASWYTSNDLGIQTMSMLISNDKSFREEQHKLFGCFD